MKILTITNSNKCDFAFFMGKVLADAYPNVIVIDNSTSHELFNAVLNPINDEDRKLEMVTRGKITYLKDIDYSPDFFKTFEYIVVYEGDTVQEGYLKHSDVLISMPDCKPTTLKNLYEMPENCEFILRDTVNKLSMNSVAQLANIRVKQIAGSLPYDPDDYAHYLSLLYNGRQRLKGLSDEYIQALTYVLIRITDENERKVEKYMKKERKEG